MTGMIICFGDCELDAERRQLRRNGKLVSVEPRVFDLLVEVIRKRERVVAHRELVESVWKGSAVSRSAVNAGMSRLRSALGDGQGRVIKSFPRYGYRFIAEVQQRPRALPTPALIGRTRELDLLASVASEARSGRGRVVFVHGEAGIGKTRLMETLALRAEDAGVPVFTGVCDESENPPLLWPWIQILGACVTALGDDVRLTQLADYGGELARVLPAVRQRFGAPSLVEENPAESRVRLLDAVSRAIVTLTAKTPMLMILDDAQWADADSLAVVRQVVQRIRQTYLLLLVGDRTAPALRRFTAEGNESTLCISLNNLDRMATAELASALSEASFPERNVAALHDLSCGNPFFIRELIRDPEFFEEGSRSVPEPIRLLLEGDLADLPPIARQLLLYAAVGDLPTFSLAAVQRAARLKVGEAANAIDMAVRARIVVPVHGSADGYRFRVPLQRIHLRYALSRQQQDQIRSELNRAQARGMRERG